MRIAIPEWGWQIMHARGRALAASESAEDQLDGAVDFAGLRCIEAACEVSEASPASWRSSAIVCSSARKLIVVAVIRPP